MPRVSRYPQGIKGQEALSAVPRQNRGAQGTSGNRAAFPLDTFFSTCMIQTKQINQFSLE
jgi:hypothetical protein